jgi:hypothetical protein
MLLTAALVAATAFGAGVQPQTVSVTLAAGGSTNVDKIVTTTKLAPQSDFVFLADNTGSMGPSINDVKANAQAIIDAIEAAGATSAVYGAGNYQDFFLRHDGLPVRVPAQPGPDERDRCEDRDPELECG